MDRRTFGVGSAVCLTSFLTYSLPGSAGEQPGGTKPSATLGLNHHWSVQRMGGSVLEDVSLPHCVAALSWYGWQTESWEDRWIYRKSFAIPKTFRGKRLFLSFERAMTTTTVTFNGHPFPPNEGGFLPFELEITGLERSGENELVLEVDARWLNVPPGGSPKGPPSIDYYLPGGVSGSVQLHALSRWRVRSMSAVPIDVLARQRQVRVTLKLDGDDEREVEVVVALRDGQHVMQKQSSMAKLARGGAQIEVMLRDLPEIMLWDVESPHLYFLEAKILEHGRPVASASVRIGFREAQFRLDGFYLNGRRLRLFGLNRHELFPYVGFAASDRAMRWDAQYLRKTLNCNIVRCSHYPQSEAFLNACDELGLLVWEEIPGWQYLGDAKWQEIAVRNTEAMILRDRHHPSIVVWGTRVNESANDPALYDRTRQLAKRLDPSRPTSGSMTPSSRKDWEQHWHEDVFAFDDYHADADGSVGIDPALPGVPYMLAEAVGQYSYGTAKNFLRRYRRAGKPEDQRAQALLHAQAHDRAARDPRNAGVIAWCGFDYASPINAYKGLKCPGVVDTFRIPKLGAAFYLAQVSPTVRPVLEPGFYWDATAQSGADKPVVFSNCDRLDVFLDERAIGSFYPDRKSYPHLLSPPFFLDLPWSEAVSSVLRMEGLVGGKVVTSRRMAADRAEDRLWIEADDRAITADGSDTTRVSFGVADKFGNGRPAATGTLTVQLTGAGVLVGDSSFDLAETGAVGAVWVRSVPGGHGEAVVEVRHSGFGDRRISIMIVRPDGTRVAPEVDS